MTLLCADDLKKLFSHLVFCLDFSLLSVRLLFSFNSTTSVLTANGYQNVTVI